MSIRWRLRLVFLSPLEWMASLICSPSNSSAILLGPMQTRRGCNHDVVSPQTLALRRPSAVIDMQIPSPSCPSKLSSGFVYGIASGGPLRWISPNDVNLAQRQIHPVWPGNFGYIDDSKGGIFIAIPSLTFRSLLAKLHRFGCRATRRLNSYA